MTKRVFNPTERMFLDRFRWKIIDETNKFKKERSDFIDKVMKGMNIPIAANQVVAVMDTYKDKIRYLEARINTNNALIEEITEMIMRKEDDA